MSEAVDVEALPPEQQRGYWWMWNDGDAPRIYERDYDDWLKMRWWLADGERGNHMPDDWHARFHHAEKVITPQERLAFIARIEAAEITDAEYRKSWAESRTAGWCDGIKAAAKLAEGRDGFDGSLWWSQGPQIACEIRALAPEPPR